MIMSKLQKATITIAVLLVIVAVAWNHCKKWILGPPLPPMIEGFFLPQYRPVAELFRRQVEEGTVQGASLAIYQQGQPLVDLWAGYADPESRRPWRGNTVTMTWACTLGATALAVATLVDRGLLDYSAKIHQYWPEFAVNGKENITLEMLMVHQAGLLSMGGHSISLLQYRHEWPHIQHLLAAAAPDFPPGSQQVFHTVTLAMYVDALIRRVDPQHRNLTQYFHQEIAKPFGIDFHIGLPLELYHRAARQHFPSLLQRLAAAAAASFRSYSHSVLHWWWWGEDESFTDPRTLRLKAQNVLTFLNPDTLMLEILNDPVQTEVGLGSLTGFGSASSLAKMYDILANQGAAGSKVLLSKGLVESLQNPVKELLSDHSSQPVEEWFAHGFGVSNNVLGETTFGHSGMVGQQAHADPTNGLGIAYVTNFLHMGPSSHHLALEGVFYNCFKKHKAKKAS